MFTLDFIAYLGLLLATALYGVRHYQKIFLPGKLLTQLLLLLFTLEILGRLWAQWYGGNQPVYHITSLLQIGYFILIFKFKLDGVRLRVFIALSLLFFVVAIYQSIATQMAYFPSFQLTLLALTAITGSLLDFFQMLMNPINTPLNRQFSFWFNSGNLIFYGCTFFVFGLMEYMLRQNLSNFPHWSITLVQACNFLLYLAYFWALRSAVHQYYKQ